MLKGEVCLQVVKLNLQKKSKKNGFIKIGTKDEMKVEILFDEMGGFECYCTASSLFLILLFSVCSIRHVCSSEASDGGQ